MQDKTRPFAVTGKVDSVKVNPAKEEGKKESVILKIRPEGKDIFLSCFVDADFVEQAKKLPEGKRVVVRATGAKGNNFGLTLFGCVAE